MYYLILLSNLIFTQTIANISLTDKTKHEMIYKKKYEFDIPERLGTLPEVGGYVPHQQISDNSPAAIMDSLCSYLFNLPKVKRVVSRVSLPSSIGAYIDKSVKLRPFQEREFTHVHTEPGPGSMHMVLPRSVCKTIIERKWGVFHPMSVSDTWSKTGVILIYAPRNLEELDVIKQIIDFNYKFALGKV